ncbi:UNVERIFIED_CONTAM: Cation transporter HKT2 [Sesamum angustifolium]|uniref:Cation transporter HKT2 n=1 Tax=Sesamum angustifolium TaxID=2727405 RepID=A0AAW2N6Q7_9LAMI
MNKFVHTWHLSSSLWARLALLFTCFSSYSCDKLKHVATRLTCLLHYLLRSFMSLLVRVNPFWIELSYSISLSLLGFFVVKSTKPRTISSSFIPRDIDLFLTSMSVATVSGVSTIEMEFFSNSQLFFLSILMFVGGEAFTSMLGLLLMRAKIQHKRTADNQKTDSHSSSHSSDHIELAVVGDHRGEEESKRSDADAGEDFKVRCMKILGYLVICYVLVVHIVSFVWYPSTSSWFQAREKCLSVKALASTCFLHSVQFLHFQLRFHALMKHDGFQEEFRPC